MSEHRDIAFLGTGLMGQPMVRRLLSREYSVQVYNRTRSKADSLVPMGAVVAKRPRDAVLKTSVIILMLADGTAINQVLADCEEEHFMAGKSIIQMGTISPVESVQLKTRIESGGGQYLEAPVLGSITEASNGTLLVLVGATEEQFSQFRQLLSCLGNNPLLVGPVGKAAALKLALNQLIAAQTAGFALSLGIIERSRVSVEFFMQVLRQSALYSSTFDKKLQRMQERDYSAPNFPTHLLLKDVLLIRREATRLGLNTFALEGIRHLLEQNIAARHADSDYSSLYETVNPDSPAADTDSET